MKIQDLLNAKDVEDAAVEVLNQHFKGKEHHFNLSVIVTMIGIYSFSTAKGDLRECINSIQAIVDTLEKTKKAMYEDLLNGK